MELNLREDLTKEEAHVREKLLKKITDRWLFLLEWPQTPRVYFKEEDIPKIKESISKFLEMNLQEQNRIISELLYFRCMRNRKPYGRLSSKDIYIVLSIKLCYGKFDREIGLYYGITHQRVQQIVDEGMELLRHHSTVAMFHNLMEKNMKHKLFMNTEIEKLQGYLTCICEKLGGSKA